MGSEASKSADRLAAEIEDSCGCVFCDIGLEPYQLLGQWWHKNSKAAFQPARCYRLSPEPKE